MTVGSLACLEWAVAGRPLPGEPVSGDVAACIPAGDGALLAVIDGLGHGPDAAAAAQLARDTLAADSGQSLASLLRLCHVALARTRGAAITLAHVQCSAGVLRWVGVGNVEAHVVRHRDGPYGTVAASTTLFGGTVGYRLPPVRASTVELRGGDLVIMATDGIDAAFTQQIATAQPVDRLAQGILARCARGTDDALVAVARVRLGAGRPPRGAC
jgi:negative regulator of sigma-B (phosphoserine phosphatase)